MQVHESNVARLCQRLSAIHFQRNFPTQNQTDPEMIEPGRDGFVDQGGALAARLAEDKASARPNTMRAARSNERRVLGW